MSFLEDMVKGAVTIGGDIWGSTFGMPALGNIASTIIGGFSGGGAGGASSPTGQQAQQMADPFAPYRGALGAQYASYFGIGGGAPAGGGGAPSAVPTGPVMSGGPGQSDGGTRNILPLLGFGGAGGNTGGGAGVGGGTAGPAGFSPSNLPGYEQWKTGVLDPALENTMAMEAASGRALSGRETQELYDQSEKGYYGFMTDYLNRLAQGSGAVNNPAQAAGMGLQQGAANNQAFGQAIGGLTQGVGGILKGIGGGGTVTQPGMSPGDYGYGGYGGGGGGMIPGDYGYGGP
jgi:hypothetical protein